MVVNGTQIRVVPLFGEAGGEPQTLERIRAAILLGRQDLGHLAVAFVRASLDGPHDTFTGVNLALE
jgi:hypothetical protein